MEESHKEQALRYIRDTVIAHQLSREDIMRTLGWNAPSQEIGKTDAFSAKAAPQKWNFSLVKILYFIGGLLVLLGVVTYIGMFWDSLGFLGQVAVTFGAGLVAYITAIILRNNLAAGLLSKLALLFSGLLLPTGVAVVLNEAKTEDWLWASFWIASGFLALYISSSKVIKNDVARFLAVISGTCLYSISFLLVVRANPNIIQILPDFFSYAIMVAGISYLSLSYRVFPATDNRRLLNDFLVFVGSVSFLGATMALKAWWLYLLPPAVLGFFYLSVKMQRRLVLFVTALFLIAYVIRVTSEYFVNVLSWPVALIFGGMMVICIGYASVVFGRRYLNS